MQTPFAPSYSSLAVLGPGEVAAKAKSLKEEKYTELLCTRVLGCLLSYHETFWTKVFKILEMNLAPCANQMTVCRVIIHNYNKDN